MNDLLDIKSPNFLFGQNAHNLVLIVMVAGVIYKTGWFGLGGK